MACMHTEKTCTPAIWLACRWLAYRIWLAYRWLASTAAGTLAC
jgi:hypothetical protein